MTTPRVSQGENTSTPIPILLDVDVDTSDTNALLYLVNDPLVEIKAITVSCGVTYIDAGVENILRFPETKHALFHQSNVKFR